MRKVLKPKSALSEKLEAERRLKMPPSVPRKSAAPLRCKGDVFEHACWGGLKGCELGRFEGDYVLGRFEGDACWGDLKGNARLAGGRWCVLGRSEMCNWRFEGDACWVGLKGVRVWRSEEDVCLAV